MPDWNEIQITSSAPIRICDLGGWTDTWFAGHGAVWSIAVQPRVQVEIHAHRHADANPCIHIFAENYNAWMTYPDDMAQHPLLAAAIAEVPPPPQTEVTIHVYADMPPGGSTGTSAAVSVALICALRALHGLDTSAAEAAHLAHRLETDRLGMQSGIQDQLAAAHGGINFIEMTDYPHARVSPVSLDEDTLFQLESRLLLLYLGRPHQSSHIHQQVIHRLETTNQTQALLEPLRHTARQATDALRQHDWVRLGTLMRHNTAAQRALHPMLISPTADDIIRMGESFAVLGWKVNGAGGDGGSLTILCGDSPAQQRQFVEQIRQAHPEVQHIPITISRIGAHTSIRQIR